MNQTQSFKEFEIDDASYSISLFPADQGLKVMAKLFKLIGEPIMQLSQAGQDKANMQQHLATAIKSLAAKIVEEEVVALAKTLCSVVTKQGSSQTLDKEFNTYFRGKYGHLFKLLTEVVEYNFADFLEGLGQGVSLPQAKSQ